MKRKWIVVAIAACAIALAGCKAVSEPEPIAEADPIAVESVTLDVPLTLTLAPGATRKLTATVNPENADDKAVTWSSSDTAVAVVGSDGTVTAHAEGTATIYAYAGGKEAACTVTVKTIDIPVEDITLSETKLTLILTLTHGETKILKATVTPDNTDDPSVLWWSSDPSVATVENDGKVTAVGEGNALIFAEAGEKMMCCEVTVLAKSIESITLDKDALVLMCGEKWKLNATITPDDAYYKGGISWSAYGDWSNYESRFVDVDGNGMVTALKEGTATIEARAGSEQAGYKCVTCTVTVKPTPIAVESVTLNPETLELHPDERGYLTAYVTPYNADDTTVTWSSSDTSVVTVDSDELFGYSSVMVTALKEGTATITAQAGGKKATCAVTVSSPFVIEDGVLVKYTGSSSTVSIPAGVTQIGSEAFKGCTSLTTVNIPASVTNIADAAFSGCNNIKTVTYGGTLAQWCSLQNYYSLIYNASSVVLDDGTDLKTLTKLKIPAGVQYIGAHAFSGCTVLKSVDIPGSVQYIGEYAFSVCTALESVDIPDSVTDIREGAFSGCEGLKTVTISKNMSSIETLVFASCKSLTSVTIPAGVKNIKSSAFIGCSNLTAITIPDGVESIGYNAFYECSKLTEIKIPNGVKSIGDAVFYDCLRLASVSIPASVTSIGEYAFCNCSTALVVTYDDTQIQWNAIKGINLIRLPKGATIRCTDTAWFVN